MREIIVGAFISLDGVIQGPGGPGEDTSGGFELSGWLPALSDPITGEAVGELLGGDYALLLGRKTYDIFAGYWPAMASQGNALGLAFGAATKYVASRDPDFPLDWENSQHLGADPVSRLRQIKAGDGPRLVSQGSADFLQTLFANDLVDELVLQTYPVVLGRGKKLFQGGAMPTTFALVDSKTSSRGVLINRYRRAGGVELGSF